MNYLFLVYGDGQPAKTAPASERDAFDDACRANDQDLRASGYILAVARLQGNSPAITVQVQNGELSLTDGPACAAVETLVGLYFVNARDLNEAVRVASRMPQARRGPIEVRLAAEFETGGL